MKRTEAKLADLRLSELKLMVELAQTQSLRELSRRQNSNPSQLSKVIRKIEKKVGLPLLQRSTRGMAFTLEGEQFLKTAKRMLELSPSLRSGGVNEKSATTIFGLAAASFLNTYLLPSSLLGFKAKHQSVQFRLLELPSKELVVSGIRGNFEMAVHLRKEDWPQTWVSKKIGMSRSGLFARAKHPLGKNARVEKLITYPFVIPIRFTKNGIQDGEDSCPLPVQDRVHGDGVMTAAAAMELLKTSDQLAFIPEIVARDAVQKGELMEIKVAEWGNTEEPLFFSVRADAVSKKIFDELFLELQKSLS